MNPTPAAEIAAYVIAFGRAAQRRRVPEADDIARDVRSHIDEALGAGESWAAIREKLGAPDALAKAYAVELLFGEEHGDRKPGRASILALLGLATGGGILTLIVLTALGSIALTFILSALLIVVLCLPIALGAPVPPYVHLGDVPAWAMVSIAAPVFAAIGWAAFLGLVSYLRWFAGSLRRALPPRRT